MSSSGLALLVAGENLNSPSTLITYKLGGHVGHRSVIVPTSDNVAGYSGGFIMGPDIKSGTQLWRVSSSGAVTKLQALPKPASNGPPYEVTAVSPDGKVFAAELGDHTDGCGVGRASRIFVVDETRGTVSQAFLPAGPLAGGVVRLRPDGHSRCHHGRLYGEGHDAHGRALGVPKRSADG